MAAIIFTSPREIYYGAGAIESVRGLLGKRALVVTDPGVKAQGLSDRLGEIIKGQEADLAIFDQVESDPSRETVGKILALAKEFQPDLFIALGGGSSIDAAKATWILYENPDMVDLPVIAVAMKIQQCVLRRKGRLIAIPTTSGTGSEVTKAAIITDLTRTPPYKATWMAPQIVPDAAILDPELTVTMPPQITANTGMDALDHAVECYALTKPSDMVDALALWAARTIFDWLPKAVANGQDLQARERMQWASLQAGLAFTNGALGFVHIMAHILGGEFHIPHGRAIAYVICPVFSFFYSNRRQRVVALAKALGLRGRNDAAKVQALLNLFNQLKKDVGIPSAIKDTDLSEDQFLSKLDSLMEVYKVRLSVVTPAMKATLGVPDSLEEVRNLWLHAWNGTTVDLK
jgi:alcohol dehydrogenase class IV